MSKRIVSEEEIYQVPRVPFTETFHPIHHADVLSVMRKGIRDVGLEIRRSEYTLTKNGMRFFGVWDLNHENGELCWSLGIRNSMDKSLALGIVSGTRVFVCSNLAFSGEYIEFRKHTKGLDLDELEVLVRKSMAKMVERLSEFQAWHEGLKNYPLPEKEAKAMLVDIFSRGVIPPSKFFHFHGLYFKRSGSTLFEFHECCTNVLRGTNLLTLPKRNRILNNVIEEYINRRSQKRPSV